MTNVLKKPLFLAFLSGLLLALGWLHLRLPIVAFCWFIPLLLAEKHWRAQRKKAKLKVWVTLTSPF
jgi:hypothetical protein